jgi:hypothetical protein
MVRLWLSWLSLFGDVVRLLVLGLRSKTSLAAENLFLRKTARLLAGTQIRPRRLDNPIPCGQEISLSDAQHLILRIVNVKAKDNRARADSEVINLID